MRTTLKGDEELKTGVNNWLNTELALSEYNIEILTLLDSYGK